MLIITDKAREMLGSFSEKADGDEEMALKLDIVEEGPMVSNMIYSLSERVMLSRMTLHLK